MFTWRPMQASDLPEVVALSELIHPDLPESRATQASRQAAYPQGCLVLQGANELCGYVFAHPIAANMPPALDRPLRALAPNPEQLYLHDLALHPKMRGSGLARAGITRILELGASFRATALISVYETAPFWARFGFVAHAAVGAEKLASYGPGATFMLRPSPEALIP